MTGETRKRKWDICFDPRTKVLLLIISMIIATTAPSLSYECALILLIAFMGILCGKVRYSIIGTIVFLALYLFTTLYLGNVTGTAYTMFTAWLSLVFKVYPCGMLAGIAVSTTRVNEFLSAMNKAHVPQKVVIPLAVMLRYLPTIREDWHFIKDAMRLRDVSPSLKGLISHPGMTIECLYSPLLMAASKAADELAIASVTRGIENGEVLIGGQNIKDIAYEKLLNNISIVFQKTFLTRDSVLENIRMGSNATLEEVRAAAKEAQIDDFIMSLPDGYDTKVGSFGSRFSGGEKQRIAIARAILKNAPILILDEATSAADPENQVEIDMAISNLCKGKTVLIVAHRLGAIKMCDKVAVVENHTITAFGTHEEVLEENHYYQRAWERYHAAREVSYSMKGVISYESK